MTRLYNDPTRFADEATEGFVAAHRRWVRAVSGGVVRRRELPAGQVAVVVGGGSGHYPAFAGLVGEGLAAGAVLGNVFASPSTAQVVSVARAVENGGGVLLSYGNYAGDVLNFTAAQDRLRGAGIDCHTVQVTDDISSADPAEKHRRRGVAGDLVVFKIAAAAAAEGAPLSAVASAAAHANDRTRTLGVAFSGCTLPGADAPLFSVPAGRMAVGLGIHGEPGLTETDLPSADELAELLVARLLEELPEDVPAAAGQRVVAVLNGLGSVKYEELFVVYRTVLARLHAAGVAVADCEVGELCTSFDMAGVSLTLLWLDADLERWWTAPADAPAFHRGLSVEGSSVGRAGVDGLGAGGLGVDGLGVDGFADAPGVDGPRVDGLGVDGPRSAEAAQAPAAGAPASQAAAAVAAEVFATIAATVADHAEELGRIDAIAGDGDHGIGMERGATAAAAAAASAQRAGAGAGTVISLAGDAWADRAGGTSGALWGLALRALGTRLGDEDSPGRADIAEAVTAARVAITTAGGAAVGDKTLVDALVPFERTLADLAAADVPLPEAWRGAAAAATEAAEATASLLPQTGRARPHAERSLGTPDAGAVSLALIVSAIADTLAEIGGRAPAAQRASAAATASANAASAATPTPTAAATPTPAGTPTASATKASTP